MSHRPIPVVSLRYPSRMAEHICARVRLRYKERLYTFVDRACTHTEWADVVFGWTDGSLGCDCNKSLFIQRHCDPEFPAFDCGERIELVALEQV